MKQGIAKSILFKVSTFQPLNFLFWIILFLKYLYKNQFLSKVVWASLSFQRIFLWKFHISAFPRDTSKQELSLFFLILNICTCQWFFYNNSNYIIVQMGEAKVCKKLFIENFDISAFPRDNWKSDLAHKFSN